MSASEHDEEARILEGFRRHAPGELRELVATLGEAGHAVHVVGGAVRDVAMGRTPGDWDVATDAHPPDVGRLFPHTTLVNARHGTTQVRIGELAFEVTTYRLDGPYGDGRRPDFVRFAASVEEDLARRDFTVNAIALDPVEETIVDPHDGLGDLRLGVIRAVGDPRLRFREDALRILRAARFCASLSFEIDTATREAMRSERAALGAVSPERIRDELLAGLVAPNPSRMIEALRESGLLGHLLPELDAAIGVTQNEYHAHDVYTHSLLACDAAPEDRPLVRLAALLHDVGKVPTRHIRKGRVTFHDHERAGSRMVSERLAALRFSRKDIRHVAHLVAQHMFHYEPEWSDAAVRRFVARVGIESIEDLLALRAADVAAKGTGERGSEEAILALVARIENERRCEVAFRVKDLALGGSDVMDALGLEPGAEVGRVLAHLLGFVLDGGENRRDDLLAEARRAFPSCGGPDASPGTGAGA